MMNNRTNQPVPVDILIVAEDNSQITTFRSVLGRRTGSWYQTKHIQKIQRLCKEALKNGQSVLLFATSDMLDQIPISPSLHRIAIDAHMEDLDFEKAGKTASQLAALWDDEQLMKTSSVKLEHRSIGLAKTCFVQFGFLYLFYSILYVELCQKILKQYQIKAVWLTNGESELEQCVLSVIRRDLPQLKVVTKRNGLAGLRNCLFNFLYRRDRLKRLDRLKSVGTCHGQNQNQKYDIVLAVCHSLQLRTAIPLANLLKKNNLSCLLIATELSTDEKTVLDTHRIPWKVVNQFLDNNRFKQVSSELTPRFQKIWQENLWPHAALKQAMTIEGVDFFKLNRHKLAAFANISLLEAAYYIEIANMVFDRHNPQLIISFSDARFWETSLPAVAHQRCKKSILLSPNPVMSADAINRYDTCDQVTVVGEHIHARLIERGHMPVSKLSIVGDLRFDNLDNAKKEYSSTKIRNDLHAPEGHDIVTITSYYTTSWHPVSEKKIFFVKICQALQAFKNMTVIVKAHPNEDENLLRKQLQTWGIQNVMVVKQYPLYPMLLYSQFVITLVSSMTPLEAMLLDIPVVSFSLSTKNTDKLFKYIEQDGVLGITEKSDLRPLFERLLDDQAFRQQRLDAGRKFIAHYIAQPLGLAGERIMRLIQNQLHSK